MSVSDYKNKVLYSSTAGFLIVSILGCINHFVYQLSGENPIIGAFVPVNESTWEHLKLLFFPFVLYTLAEFIVYGHKISGFLFSRVTGLLFGLIFIPAAFYTYTAITEKNFFIADILLYFAAVALSFKISSKRIVSGTDMNKMRTVPGIILIICLTVLFVGFTFYPPSSPLFKSP